MTVKNKYNIAAFLICLFTAVFSALGAYETMLPGIAPPLLPMSELFYARALGSKEPLVGVEWARRSIRVAPLRPENWMLLAYLYQRLDGYVSVRTVDAIRTSYSKSALSLDVTQYRLSYLSGIWEYLPSDVKSNLILEANAYATNDNGRKFICDLYPKISNGKLRIQIGLICFVESQKSYLTYIQSVKDNNSGY